MTKYLTCIKFGSASIAVLTLSACSSVPQDGVVATDIGGSFNQMWSSVFTGELRPAPNPHYAFGASDATLNTQQLVNRISRQAAAQPSHNYLPSQNYIAQNYMPQSFVPQSRIQPQGLSHSQRYSAQPVENYEPKPQIETSPWERTEKRKGFGKRVKSIFKPSRTHEFESTGLGHYETPQTVKSASLPEPKTIKQRPAMSQPVMAESRTTRDAYPAQIDRSSTIPPRASINDNLAKMGRTMTPASAPAPANDWQTANQEIGDSLSYVKMGGGSQISDWQACDKQAGGYFNATASGFIVDPNFDVCMRGKGYKPEAEAEAALNAQTAETKLPTPKPTLQTRQIDTQGIPTSRRYPSREKR